MKARKMTALFALVRRLEDAVLLEIATVPQNLLLDFEDRAIVAVARGERERRGAK